MENPVTQDFDIKKSMIKVQNKDYLPAAARMYWFRCVHTDWSIETEIVEHVDDHLPGKKPSNYAIVRTVIKDETGRIRATAVKKEDQVGFPDYLEKSETSSIGRALAILGFGTLQALELDEGDVRLTDSPTTKTIVTKPSRTVTPKVTDYPMIKSSACKICGKSDNFFARKQAIDSSVEYLDYVDGEYVTHMCNS